MEEENLYIPMGLKEDDEYWQGFGRKELIQTAITVVVLTVIDVILYKTVFKNTIFVTVFFLTSIAASIMFYTKDYTNLSIYDQVRNMMDFKKSQKIYEYKYLDEWQC
jgi:hypothetical protein